MTVVFFLISNTRGWLVLKIWTNRCFQTGDLSSVQQRIWKMKHPILILNRAQSVYNRVDSSTQVSHVTSVAEGLCYLLAWTFNNYMKDKEGSLVAKVIIKRPRFIFDSTTNFLCDLDSSLNIFGCKTGITFPYPTQPFQGYLHLWLWVVQLPPWWEYKEQYTHQYTRWHYSRHRSPASK